MSNVGISYLMDFLKVKNPPKNPEFWTPNTPEKPLKTPKNELKITVATLVSLDITTLFDNITKKKGVLSACQFGPNKNSNNLF